MKQTSLISPSRIRGLFGRSGFVALITLGSFSVGMNLAQVSAQDVGGLPSIVGQTVEHGQFAPGSIAGAPNVALPTPAAPLTSGGVQDGLNGWGGGTNFPPSPVSHSGHANTQLNGGYSSTNAQPLSQMTGQPVIGNYTGVTSLPPQNNPSQMSVNGINANQGYEVAPGFQSAPGFNAASGFNAAPHSHAQSTFEGANSYGGAVGSMGSIGTGADCGFDNFVVDEFQGEQFPMQYTDVGNQVAVGSGVNTVVGVSGLAFQRDYARNRLLSTGPADLFTRGADHGGFGGLDVNLARRRSNGRGFGFRFFEMFPNTASASVTPFPTTALVGLAAIGVVGGGTTQQVFNDGNFHAISRDTEIRNFEANMLRNGSQFMTKRNRPGVFEYLIGFRYFQFNEALNYESQTDNVGAYPGYPNPTRAQYLNSVENSLFGGQIGTHYEVAVRNRLSVAMGAKAGLFNNRVNTRQRVDYTSRVDGSISNPVILAGPYANQAFDDGAETNDITFLGEVDLGLIYQLSRKVRARAGYRAIGVSNLALAEDQIQNDFSSLGLIKDPDVDGNLLLHGGYFGLECAF